MRPIQYPSIASRISATALKGAQPQFRCRLFAFMTEDPRPGDVQQKVLLDTLLYNPNSLKNQSRPRIPSPYRTTGSTYFGVEDWADITQRGNSDGWGLVAYMGKGPLNKHSLTAAHQDHEYDQTVQQAVAQQPTTILAHLLKNGKGRAPNPNNLHPFHYGPWTSMLNGSVQGIFTPQMQDQIQHVYGPLLKEIPKGTTAGEAGLYVFLGRLKDRYGTLDPKIIGLEGLQKTFAETVRDLICLSKPEYVPVVGPDGYPTGQVQTRPAANFVMSDGNTILAFRHGRSLFLGRQTLPNGFHHYLLTSELPDPSKEDTGPTQWLAVPEDHVVTVQRDSSGHIQAQLTPIQLLASMPFSAGSH